MIWIIIGIWTIIAIVTMAITKNERQKSQLMKNHMWLYKILTLPIQIVLLLIFVIIILFSET